MALDYLLIPGIWFHFFKSFLVLLKIIVATSVDVERVFSKGQILLSHVRNLLSVQLTRALMCLGVWSTMGYVSDSDVKAITTLPDLKEGKEEQPLDDEWDAIISKS